jgi:hypothetical protein
VGIREEFGSEVLGEANSIVEDKSGLVDELRQ